jgi:hypothetical protein
MDGRFGAGGRGIKSEEFLNRIQNLKGRGVGV